MLSQKGAREFLGRKGEERRGCLKYFTMFPSENSKKGGLDVAVNPNPLLVPTTQCRPHGPPLPSLLLYLLQGFFPSGDGQRSKGKGDCKKGRVFLPDKDERTDGQTPLGGKDEKKKRVGEIPAASGNGRKIVPRRKAHTIFSLGHYSPSKKQGRSKKPFLQLVGFALLHWAGSSCRIELTTKSEFLLPSRNRILQKPSFILYNSAFSDSQGSVPGKISATYAPPLRRKGNMAQRERKGG